MKHILTKYFLLGSLMLLIFLTGMITMCVLWSRLKESNTHYPTFNWNGDNIDYPTLTTNNFKSHTYQKYIEQLVAEKLRLRNFFIKVNSEIYYTLFRKSFAENSRVIIGKNNQLFELQYISAYCQQNDDRSQEKLAAWADKIAEMSQYFETHGKTFVYWITPSKAEYMPENLPKRFHCQNHGINDYVYQMEKLLRARHVHMINAADLTAKVGKEYGVSMFPRGGTHWNWLAATMATNSLIQKINTDKKFYLPPLNFSWELNKVHDKDCDTDLLRMIKLFKFYYDYDVPNVNFSTPVPTKKINAAIIGGSFDEYPILIFLKNNSFARIDYYFYYRTHKVYKDGNLEPQISVVDADARTNINNIASADVIILEENSMLVISNHGKQFYEAFKLATHAAI